MEADIGTGCPSDCFSNANQGHCVDNKECVCSFGYFGEDCKYGVNDELSAGWYTTQALLLLSYFVLFILSVTVLAKDTWRDKSQEKQKGGVSLTHFNIQRLLSISLIVVVIDGILAFAVDPFNYRNTSVPYSLSFFFFLMIVPLLSTNFLFVIAHWAEVYERTVYTLRQEEMLQKINQKYQSNITLEGILKNVRFMTRLKIPFIVIAILGCVITLAFAIETGISPEGGGAMITGILYSILYAIMFTVQALGFVIYGFRLVRLMPKPLQKRMKNVTWLNVAQAGFMIIAFICSIISSTFGGTPTGFLITLAATHFFTVMIVAINLFIIANRSNLLPNWCIKLKSKITTSSSEHTTAQPTGDLTTQ